MPSRLRLFVKKRGTRRTGPRWPGLLAEGALFAGLTAAGIYGLYWLVASVLLADGVNYGWWPWLAIVIPLALAGYGAANLMLLLWQSAARPSCKKQLAGNCPEHNPHQPTPCCPPCLRSTP